MGWELRNNRSYYYRKSRYFGKVTSSYIGSYMDELTRNYAEIIEFNKGRAKEALETKELIRAEKQKIKQQYQQEQQEYEQLSNTVTEALANINALVQVVLLTNNFHQHKYTWRLRRKTKGTIKERKGYVSNAK